MPPPREDVHTGIVLARDAVTCRLFHLHNVLYGQQEAGGTLCALYRHLVL